MPYQPLGEPARILAGWLVDETDQATRVMYALHIRINRSVPRDDDRRDQGERVAAQTTGGAE